MTTTNQRACGECGGTGFKEDGYVDPNAYSRADDFWDAMTCPVCAGSGRVEAECQGHPAGPNDPMGQTVYCDGSCR